jgi:hypothetical protein
MVTKIVFKPSTWHDLSMHFRQQEIMGSRPLEMQITQQKALALTPSSLIRTGSRRAGVAETLLSWGVAVGEIGAPINGWSKFELVLFELITE